MSTHRYFDRLCCVVLALTLILTVAVIHGKSLGIETAGVAMGYEKTLFDTSKVHTINIVMEDWEEFTENCASEEYYPCTLVIDNEAYKNVAIRGKGNTSLTQVEAYGNDRYSYKIEFDHYDDSNTYYGLDKLCLNNLIQDNTYMKDYLTYQMMNEIGVAAPLCSYVYITVNGQDWGLYLAVEGVEESFLRRNFGSNYGELYKPDSMSMGGGRGNGKGFDMDDFFPGDDTQAPELLEQGEGFPEMPDRPGGAEFDPGEMPMTPGEFPDMEGGGQGPDGMQGGGMLNGSDDVLLKYIDDACDSYPNIFDNAKTDITDADKARLIAALKRLSTGEELGSTVDVEQVIKYFVVHNFVLNFDSYTGSMIHNYYLYEKDGQLQMIPWDYNLAFGGFQSADSATSLVNEPIDTPVSGGSTEDRPMLAWIFSDEAYLEQYHQYFSQWISAYFDSGVFEEKMDRVTAMIAPYVEKDPTKFCTYEVFRTGAETLREFCLLRAESVKGQLEGTIGSARDTQVSDTLIDAGDLQISDMGSMNQSMGAPEMGRPDEALETEETGDAPRSEEGTMPQGPDGMNQDKMPFGVPDGAASDSPGDTAQDGWIWMGASAGMLALGLCIAFFYKRRWN